MGTMDKTLTCIRCIAECCTPPCQLAKRSMPLCMQHLHQKLKENHHLRHGGRMQYGLFLKGIGLSLEDALRFWQNEFTKVMQKRKLCLDVITLTRCVVSCSVHECRRLRQALCLQHSAQLW